jgi:hypothetical protein
MKQEKRYLMMAMEISMAELSILYWTCHKILASSEIVSTDEQKMLN